MPVLAIIFLNSLRAHRATALGDEHEPAILRPVSGKLAERPHFVPLEGCVEGVLFLNRHTARWPAMRFT